MCNLIIITSSVPLSFWFRYMLYNKSEDLKQFYRRISAYVEITDTDVSVFESIDSSGKPSGFPKMYHNRVAELKAQPRKKKTNFGEAFSAICDEIPIEQVIEFFNQCADRKKRY